MAAPCRRQTTCARTRCHMTSIEHHCRFIGHHLFAVIAYNVHTVRWRENSAAQMETLKERKFAQQTQKSRTGAWPIMFILILLILLPSKVYLYCYDDVLRATFTQKNIRVPKRDSNYPASRANFPPPRGKQTLRYSCFASSKSLDEAINIVMMVSFKLFLLR